MFKKSRLFSNRQVQSSRNREPLGVGSEKAEEDVDDTTSGEEAGHSPHSHADLWHQIQMQDTDELHAIRSYVFEKRQR